MLDPPRAGAGDQVAQIVLSGLQRVVYISCNPASWAKDARVVLGRELRHTIEKVSPDNTRTTGEIPAIAAAEPPAAKPGEQDATGS